jgi:hypothetical protein
MTAYTQTQPTRASAMPHQVPEDRKYAFGCPSARVRHVELPFDPNGRAIILGVER